MIGPTIRRLRRDKNIKSYSLYEGILSRTAVVKFEKGISDTSTEKFFVMLERLNITLEEFYWILYQKENNDFEILNGYIWSFYTKDINKLHKLKEKSYLYFVERNNVKYLHYHSIITLFINLLEGKELDEEKKLFIQNYLLECNNWGYYEIVLFTNSLEFYSLEVVNLVYKRCNLFLLKFQNSKRYKNEQSIFILNILEKTIKLGDMISTEFYLNELKKVVPSIMDNMYLSTMLNYFSCLFMILKGDVDQKGEVEFLLSYIHYLNLDNLYKQCKELYEYVLANSHTNKS